jgi:site-specific DNA-methyltransferase (adenine-specific)
MSFNKVMFSSVHDDWSTPKDTYDALDKEFRFNDDPCPLGGTDGLDREWGSSTFVNPPYSKIKEWVAYAYSQSQKGKTVVMLIPSRTDTRWWHDFVMKAKEIRFIKGRLKFGGQKNSAPFPSAVVIFRDQP